jgi:hypothetical protein
MHESAIGWLLGEISTGCDRQIATLRLEVKLLRRGQLNCGEIMALAEYFSQNQIRAMELSSMMDSIEEQQERERESRPVEAEAESVSR